MRRETVFFITLIDFLLQIIFFSVFWYIAEKAIGSSDIMIMTPEHTRMTPKEYNKRAIELVNNNGGLVETERKIKTMYDIEKKVGNANNIIKIIEEAQKKNEGSGTGKPSCLYEVNNGRKEPIFIATAVAYDDRIVFEKNTEELNNLLNKLGYTYEEVKDLTLQNFKIKFSKIKQLYPECWYYIRLKEKTRYTEPRDSVEQCFIAAKRRIN